MIHAGLDLRQDAAMCLLCEKSLAAARAAMDAMSGQPIDPEDTMLLLFQAVGALMTAFPDDIDAHTVFTMSSKTFLATQPGWPANDLHPPPGAA